jgi:hypothetical protein
LRSLQSRPSIIITSSETLRTASLALVYSTAEYCAPVWLNSLHTIKIDIQLNNTMRLISGTVNLTQLQWLSVLANITPPKLRREATTVHEFVNCRRHPRSFSYEPMLDIPDQRLLSRRSMWNFVHDAFFKSWCLDCAMVSIATCQRWFDCGSQCSTTWFWFSTTLLGVVEPSREDART